MMSSVGIIRFSVNISIVCENKFFIINDTGFSKCSEKICHNVINEIIIKIILDWLTSISNFSFDASLTM